MLLSFSVASPGWAARIPRIGAGTALGVDPYVQDFQSEMSAVKAAMVAMGAAVAAIQVPPGTRSGALAAKAAMAAEMAGMAGLEARAEAARRKMVGHLEALRGHDGVSLGAAPKEADFGSKKDDPGLAPKDDRVFRGARPEQLRDSLNSQPQASGASRPSLRSVNSPVGYGGSVGAGFAGAPMTPRAEFTAASRPAAQTDSAPIALGSGSGPGAGGLGAGSSRGKAEADAPPPANPGLATLSKNSSDVAVKAAAAKEKAMEEAKAAREKAAEDEKQRQQQMQQMAMQGVMMAVQLVAQAAQAAKKKQEEGGQQADNAAASAPAGS